MSFIFLRPSAKSCVFCWWDGVISSAAKRTNLHSYIIKSEKKSKYKTYCIYLLLTLKLFRWTRIWFWSALQRIWFWWAFWKSTYIMCLCQLLGIGVSYCNSVSLELYWNMYFIMDQYILCFYHYIDIIMSLIASQITSISIVCSTICSDIDQRKHESSMSPAFVAGIHQLTNGFPSLGASNMGNVSIWWFHYGRKSFGLYTV